MNSTNDLIFNIKEIDKIYEEMFGASWQPSGLRQAPWGPVVLVGTKLNQLKSELTILHNREQGATSLLSLTLIEGSFSSLTMFSSSLLETAPCWSNFPPFLPSFQRLSELNQVCLSVQEKTQLSKWKSAPHRAPLEKAIAIY